MRRLPSSTFVRMHFATLRLLVARKQTQLIVGVLLALVTLPVAAVALHSNAKSNGTAATSQPTPSLAPADVTAETEQQTKAETAQPSAPAQTNGSASVRNQTNTTITVNGHKVTPPSEGSTNQTVITEDGTKFRVESRTQSSTSGEDEDTSSEVDYDYESEISIERETEIREERD